AEPRVELNRATQAELEALPGIGPVLAERIVAWRSANGPFISAEQIMDVEGIGEKKYAELKDSIYVEDTQ
ncbi:MAG: helix-hairpin-helix domain-containing protein, partial [Oscillospiraceae bacterium]|nr:helix-hairpin-helix domain-containing protein [Oscillospiraceae bacterium]